LLVLNIGGEEVQATETHPFQVVGQGMTAAGNLKVGDKIERKDGESAEVESIALKVGSFPVYNLEVADAHTYFVGQQELLVHNGCEIVKANIGNKLDYFLGKATGAKHNIDRSMAMVTQLKSIGLNDTPATRKLLAEHLDSVINNADNIVKTQANGRVVRESLIVGPHGSVKIETIWEGNRLITGNIFGGLH